MDGRKVYLLLPLVLAFVFFAGISYADVDVVTEGGQVSRVAKVDLAALKAELKREIKAELAAEKVPVAAVSEDAIASAVSKAIEENGVLGGLFKGTTVGGFLDTNFSYNFRQSGEATSENNGDIGGWNFIGENDDNSFVLQNFALWIDKAATDEHPVGWQMHTYWGELAKRITFLGEGAGTTGGTDDTARNDIFTVATANITWNIPVGGRTIPTTMGKQYTWIGYELVENIGNPNYSHGVTYNNAIPFTHMGLSFDVSEFLPSDKWGLQLKYVNGWDSFIDNNESKSYGFYLTYQPNDDFFISLATIYGNEGWNVREGGSVAQDFTSTNNGGATMMYDIVATYALPQVEKLSLGANWDYGYIEDFIGHADGSNGANFTGLSGAHWWAAVGYAMYDFTDNQQGAFRFEYLNDADGARAFGYSISTYTYTHNITIAENLMLRPEVRYNKHNVPSGEEPSHGKSTDNLTADSETIFTIGAEYVF